MLAVVRSEKTIPARAADLGDLTRIVIKFSSFLFISLIH